MTWWIACAGFLRNAPSGILAPSTRWLRECCRCWWAATRAWPSSSTKPIRAYEGEIRLGFSTDTYDATGERTGEPRPVNVSLEQAAEAAKGFLGKTDQIPPPFSAKKIAGVPAYKLARKGESPELKAVPVEIRTFEVTSVDGDLVRFTAQVSAGTYMRTLAHELGEALGTGAHLAALRRTAAGQFAVESAVPLAELDSRRREWADNCNVR